MINCYGVDVPQPAQKLEHQSFRRHEMFIINTKEKRAVGLARKSFSELNMSERYDLQEWIVDNPEILGERLLIIQKEFAGFSDTKERLDLLALDENGKLVIIENKLDDSGRDVSWQALKYASYCAALAKNEICEIYQKYLGEQVKAEEMLCDFYDEADYENIKLNPIGADQRMIFVAANFRKEVTSTVLWLREHNIDIKCIKLTPYVHNAELFLDTEQILPIQDIGDYQIKLSAKRQEDIISQNSESSRAKQNYAFWEKALPVLREKTGLFANVSPTKDHWVNGTSGFSGIQYNAVILLTSARAELYIDTGNKEKNEKLFHALLRQKGLIEQTFGAALDWQELPERRACRIGFSSETGGITEQAQWDDNIRFLSERIGKMIQSFRSPLENAFKQLNNLESY